MRGVRVARTFAGTVAEAESCWYQTDGWAQWVDGLDSVLSVDGDWPAVGSSVTWQSSPAGRGRVVERVAAYQPLEGQVVEVTDDSIRGRQSVDFIAAPDGVEVTLALEYQLLRRSPVSPIVDLLFIRRAMTASLDRTLGRFGPALAAARAGRRA